MPQVPMKTPAVSEKNSCQQGSIQASCNPIGFGYGHIGTTKSANMKIVIFMETFKTASRQRLR